MMTDTVVAVEPQEEHAKATPSAFVKDSQPPALAAAESVVLSSAETDCLFNWGEDSYPTTFTPRRPASTSAAPYYYRRYTGTNVYLGVSSTDNHLVYLDA